MKNIVWTRIDDRLIHGQVMTQWIQYTEANEVLIIDDGVAKDSFLQMVMKSSVPGKISLKVLSVKDAIGYLNEDGTHEKIIILVKTPVVLDELSDAGACLRYCIGVCLIKGYLHDTYTARIQCFDCFYQLCFIQAAADNDYLVPCDKLYNFIHPVPSGIRPDRL